MQARLLIYGATGYTGTLIARRATERGLRPIVAARNGAKLKLLAESLGVAYRVVNLEEANLLAEALGDIHVVLNTAGPFSATAPPMVDACLRTGTHYLDIAGEIPVFEDLHRRDAEARSRGVMIRPGVGFIVVPSDCLAAHVARKLPRAQHLAIGISRSTLLSRGSVKTIIELWRDTVRVRRHGAMVSVPIGHWEREFDYGRGPRVSAAVSWGDLFTAFQTTQIPNIEVYHEVSPSERAAFRLSRYLGPLLESAAWRRLLEMQTGLLPDGPSGPERGADRRVIVAEAEDDSGHAARCRLTTPDAYGFTAVTALTVVERVLNDHLASGFQTPARVYGPDFVLACEGAVREDVGAITATHATARPEYR